MSGPGEPVADMALFRLRKAHPDVAIREEGFGWIACVDGREFRSTSLILLRLLLEHRPPRITAAPVRWTPRSVL